jgi:glutaryl-CoA dehydrogenase (non-decarboxylating)
MSLELTPQQIEQRAGFRQFARERVSPGAEEFDATERLPPALIAELAAEGYLGAIITPERGGLGMDRVTFGLLNEAIGGACSSVRSLLTVHSMVSHAIQRWGTPTQQAHWLPRLAAGETIGAVCLSEPEAGSDVNSIATTATPDNDCYVLQGRKSWTSFGQIAGCFLVFARSEKGTAAFVVERDTPGLTINPIHGLAGTRAAMLAEVHLDGCLLARDSMLGGLGFGITAVGATALDLGRYSVAWGCVGIAQACLDASVAFVRTRSQFGRPLHEHALVQQMITNMITDVNAARLLCLAAGIANERAEASAITDTMIAKYFASTAAARAARDAVQLHGARGCTREYPVERYLRDAKVMEIVEGSTQIQQLAIARQYLRFATTGT